MARKSRFPTAIPAIHKTAQLGKEEIPVNVSFYSESVVLEHTCSKEQLVFYKDSNAPRYVGWRKLEREFIPAHVIEHSAEEFLRQYGYVRVAEEE